MFGELVKPDVRSMKDIDAREIFIFAPLVGLVLWMGIYPASFIAPMAPSIEKIVKQYQAQAPELPAAEVVIP